MADKRPKGIILVTIDALRGDRLGCYGYGKDTTPNIDALASESVLYKEAYSAGSYTRPSHTAMLTGRYPGNTSLFFSQKSMPLDRDRDVMLQEVLSANGRETAAFVSSIVLGRKWGLDSGFKLYDEETTAAEENRPSQLIRPAEDTNKSLFKWIGRNRDREFFAWVHYFDTHGPYTNPEPYASMFRLEDYGPAPIPLKMVPDSLPGGIPEYQMLRVKKDEKGVVVDYETDARYYFSQYDGGVRHADDAVGNLIGFLKSLGLYDDTMLIVTSDHGEAMGEEGVYFFHGLTVTPDQVRVPLIIKHPGRKNAGKTVSGAVSLVDIMPTVLDAARIKTDGLKIDGVPLKLDGHRKNRVILAENEWQRAVIGGGLFLLKEKDNIRDGFAFYYDSKDLCRGTRLFETSSWRELDASKVPVHKQILELASIMEQSADPREVLIRNCAIARQRLETDNSALSGRNNKLEGLRDSLTGRTAELEKVRDALTNEKNTLGNRIKEVEGQRDSLAGRTAELEREREALLNEKTTLTNQKNALECVRDSLTCKTANLEKERDVLTGRTAELEKARDALLNDKNALANQKKDLEVVRDALTGRTADLEKERDALVLDFNETRAGFEKTVEDLRGIVSGNEKEITGLDRRLADIVGSKSMRITYPLRWVSAKLKGIKPGY